MSCFLRILSVLPAPFAAAPLAAALGLIETGDAVLLRTVGRLFGRRGYVLGSLQPVYLLAGAVLRDDLLDARDGERGDVDHRILARREGHRAGQNVVLDQIVFAVHGLQRFAQTRELLAGVDVGVVLVHHAALELRALSGEFLGIERNFLYAGGAGRDARKTRHPRCAAQLASAGTQSTDASRLLPRADLLHLDTYVEPFGEDLDQFAEVHAFVGDIVENGLDLVALILHVADLHVESHVGRDLARRDHRLVFQFDGFLPLLDVVGLGFAVYLLEFAVEGVESRAAHLARHQIARERNDADVVAGRSFDRHDVAPLERQVVDILVECAAGVLETHFDDVGRKVFWVLFEPCGLVEFETSVAEFGFAFRTAVAEGAAAAYFGFECFRMLFFGIHGGYNLRKDTQKF